MILNTFAFILIVFILIFAAFVVISPIVNSYFEMQQKVTTDIEQDMWGNVTNTTKQQFEAQDNVRKLLPWLLVIGFILSVFIYLSYTEIIKSRGGGGVISR